MSAHSKTWIGLCSLALLVLGGALTLSWLPAADEPAAGKRYAILVGVELYEHRKLREPEPLKYPVDDATDMAKLLRKLGYEVVLLTDDTGKSDVDLLPTKANIEKALQTTLRKCRAQDTVLLGFAGHGLQFAGQKDAYFCPQDARPFSDETKTLVSISTIYSELEKSFAGVKVILVDACRNDPDPSRGRGLDADSAPPPPKGVAALFSCSAGQKAYENDELKHGIFFHHVLEGFTPEAANRRGEVTFEGLAIHVRESVPRSMKKYLPDREQSPNLKADLVGTPPILASLSIPAGRSVVPDKPLTASPPSGTAETPPLAVAPFDAAKARQYQQAWAKHLKLEVETTNTLGMDFRLIPPGEFSMGSEEEVDDLFAQFPKFLRDLENGKTIRDLLKSEQPSHKVRITKPFYLGKYEVSKGEFRKFVDDTNYRTEAEKDGKGGYGWDESKKEFGQKTEYTWKDWGVNQSDESPVVNVTWNDAVRFCEWLSKKEGKTYRLPTEAEWEHACRAGTTTRFHNGDGWEGVTEVGNVADITFKEKFTEYPSDKLAESRDGYAFTAPRGKFARNGWGLYDMHGNVWEWCSDWYGEKYYASSPTNDPQGPETGSNRVDRGGSWDIRPVDCRSAYRFWDSPSDRRSNLGFRLARSSRE